MIGGRKKKMFVSGSNLVVVGCGDGSVRLFDRRLSPQDARVMTWREHSAWVVGVHLKAKSPEEGRLISGW